MSEQYKDEPSTWTEGPVGHCTLAVQGGTSPEAATGAILTPIYASTAFVQPSVEDYLTKGYSYSRQANPTVRALEKRIAALEGGKDAICVSSGMAATVAVFSAFLKTGDHCILTQCSYGGTNRVVHITLMPVATCSCARVHFSKYVIEFSYVDMRDTNAVRLAVKANTKLIFSETPTNPILQLVDVAKINEIAKEYGILHACDSTFATPLITKPLELGADMAVISTTKYYDGHNVTVGGCVIVRTDELYETLSLQRNIMGSMMAPNVAFSQLQTVKTLPLRIQRQSASALKIAQFLETHPAVESVSYPGLDSFPQRDLAQRQHKGGLHGGMVSFEVKGGTAAGRKLMNSVKRPWYLAENLGACESIITCPSVFTHANMLPEDRKKVGITDGMIRLSVGLEDAEDLIRSLDDALNQLVPA